MAQFTGVDELNGLYKRVYAKDGPVNVIPEVGLLVKMLKLSDADKEGDRFVQNVVVAHSHGFTYNTTSNTAYTLNNAVAMTTKEATVQGSEIILRDAISYKAAAKSAGGNVKAFRSAVELVLENMQDSHTKRLELSLLYGGYGIGKTSSSANASTTSTVVTLTDASWAVGIWSGAENAVINFYNGSSLVSSGADADFIVAGVDPDNKKLTLTGTTTGIAALDTSIGSGTRDIFWKGAKSEECYGLEYIMRNTGSLFGIDASVYSLWKSNVVSAGSAQLTMAKVLKGVARAYGRGLVGKAKLLCNPLTWANLAADLAALRKYDASYQRGKGENGFESITYYAQNGEIEIIGYGMIKEGLAFMFPAEGCLKRLGASEISFNTPGMGDKIFTQLANNAGFELRNYSNQAILAQKPATCVLFDLIVNA
jgi:hypothetical protein